MNPTPPTPPEANGRCPCGAAASAEVDLCPACGRLWCETAAPRDIASCEPAPCDPGPCDPGPRSSTAPRAPVRYARLPLLAALVILFSLVAWIHRERDRPWEELPSFSERPSGPTARLQMNLATAASVRGTLRLDLRRLRIRRWNPQQVESGKQRATYFLVLEPEEGRDHLGGSARLRLDRSRIEEGEWPEGLAAWEDLLDLLPSLLAEPRPAGRTVERAIRLLGSRPLRAGQRFAAQFDSERSARMFPGLPDLGPGRGWLACTVESVGRYRVRLRLGGGLRLSAPPATASWFGPADGRRLPAMARVLTRSLLRPLGAVHQVKARLEGEVVVNPSKLLPARVALDLSVVVRGEVDGRRYEMDADLVVSTPGWVVARSSGLLR